MEICRLFARGSAQGARVSRGVDLAQLVDRDQGVDLGRGDRGVSEQLLDDADVRSSVEQMGRERVPQRVRRDVGGDPGRVRPPCRAPSTRTGVTAARRGRSGRRPASPDRLRTAPAGRGRGRPSSASAAYDPSGTSRSLLPLPTRRTVARRPGRGRRRRARPPRRSAHRCRRAPRAAPGRAAPASCRAQPAAAQDRLDVGQRQRLGQPLGRRRWLDRRTPGPSPSARRAGRTCGSRVPPPPCGPHCPRRAADGRRRPRAAASGTRPRVLAAPRRDRPLPLVQELEVATQVAPV